MKKASSSLFRTQDFKSFTDLKSKIQSTVKNITNIDIKKEIIICPYIYW